MENLPDDPIDRFNAKRGRLRSVPSEKSVCHSTVKADSKWPFIKKVVVVVVSVWVIMVLGSMMAYLFASYQSYRAVDTLQSQLTKVYSQIVRPAN